MQLDSARSRLTIYTEAEGFLSALAHDLELVVAPLEGEATDATATLRFSPSAIRVSGVTKRGKLDTSVLSASDRESIERQIREELLPGAEVVTRGTLEGKRVAIEVVTSRKTTRLTIDVAISEEGASKRVRGRAELSLTALGAPAVKGPMGAFRVKDRVTVEVELVFGPRPSPPAPLP